MKFRAICACCSAENYGDSGTLLDFVGNMIIAGWAFIFERAVMGQIRWLCPKHTDQKESIAKFGEDDDGE